jgi:hypothetical protein
LRLNGTGLDDNDDDDDDNNNTDLKWTFFIFHIVLFWAIGTV